MISQILVQIVLVSIATCVVTGFSGRSYGKLRPGRATYYGYTSGGNCAMRGRLPVIYRDMLPVAINHAQYDKSHSCGACIKITRTGKGLGATPPRAPRLAYVHDRCPECPYNALDLSEDGDGIWKIDWKFVPCPHSKELQVLFEGSNQFYRKMQVRGTKSPVRSFVAGGVAGVRTQDNFFIFKNGKGLPNAVSIELRTVLGERITARLPGWKADGIMTLTNVRVHGPIKSAPAAGMPARGRGGAPGRLCVPNWKGCQVGRGKRPCCGGSARCVVRPSGVRACVPGK